MPCIAKTEQLEYLPLDTVQAVLDVYGSLYGMGYRGSLGTTGESARIDMSMPDQVPVSVAVGDVILYKTSPAVMVVTCKTHDEFAAQYDII